LGKNIASDTIIVPDANLTTKHSIFRKCPCQTRNVHPEVLSD